MSRLTPNNKTIGLELQEKNKEVASLFVCSHENGLDRLMMPVVYTLDYDLAMIEPYKIGRGNEREPVEIIIPTDAGISSHISRVQGLIAQINGVWCYKQESANSKTVLVRKHISTDVTDTIELKDFDILKMGWNDEKKSFCCTVVFMSYNIGLNIQSVSISSGNATIGRCGENNSIILPIPFVSANHAKISRNGNDLMLTDLKSTNGTWFSDEWLKGSKKIFDVDVFSICEVLFVRIGNTLFYTDPMSSVSFKKEVIIKANIKEKAVQVKSSSTQKVLLKNIDDIEIKRGSLVAIIGGSGAGKSTLMRCLNGMDENYEGSIIFDGNDIKSEINKTKKKYLIGSVPQETIVHPYLTVEQELTQAAKLRRLSDSTKNEIKNIVAKVINEDIRLTGKGDEQKLNTALSGGERRRVSIAIELVAERTLLCLDEPDAGLDPLSKRMLFEMLKRLTMNDNTTILVIIHDVSFIDIFDQVIIMGKKNDEGRLVFSGTPQEAYKKFNTNDFIDIYAMVEDNVEKYVVD